jgi:hypothetical protein
MLQFVSTYVWEHEALLLKRHEDVPCPWIHSSQQDATAAGNVLWANFRHEGSIDDEWFTAFLLSYLTDRFKVRLLLSVLNSSKAVQVRLTTSMFCRQ